MHGIGSISKYIVYYSPAPLVDCMYVCRSLAAIGMYCIYISLFVGNVLLLYVCFRVILFKGSVLRDISVL